MEDAYERLWIGHDRGIYRVCRRDLMAWIEGRRTRVHCVPYTEEDGLEGLETNGQKSYPPGIRLRDGRIAYATVGGVALIDPSPARDATNGPPTHIERLDADGITRFTRRPGSAAPASWDRGSAPVRVPPSPNRAVEIAFTACSFRSSEPSRFRYRLVGLCSRWVEAVGLQKASYAALPAGRYLFEVQAASVHGHPKADTLRGAVARVCDQAERTIQAAGVRCRFELPDELPDRACGPELRREMLMACNEAIHNAIRHARASVIRLGIALEANHLIVRVEDDGRGFAVEPGLGAAVVGSDGLGLEGLQRRMEAIGGRCEIHSQVDRGTAVVLRLPLEPPSAAAEN